MLDIPSISATVAAVGVLIGVAYYILDLRNQKHAKTIDLVIRLYDKSTSNEWEEAYMRLLTAPFEDYDDFCRRYGGLVSTNPVSIAADQIASFYEQLGYLLHNKLINANMVFDLFSIARPWNKMKPIVYGARKQLDLPGLYEWFEYLYYEMKKREKERHFYRGVSNG